VARGDIAMARRNMKKPATGIQELKSAGNLGNYYSSINVKKAVEYYQRYLEARARRREDLFFQLGFLYQKAATSPKPLNHLRIHRIRTPASRLPSGGWRNSMKRITARPAAQGEYDAAPAGRPETPLFIHVWAFVF